MPFSVLLIEVVFFQDLRRPIIRKRLAIISAVILVAMLLLAILFFFGGNPLGFLSAYGN